MNVAQGDEVRADRHPYSLRKLFMMSAQDRNGLNELDEEWDLVIQPHSSLFSLQLGDVWRHRDLLYLFTRRDIVSFYKQTILGPLWVFIQLSR